MASRNADGRRIGVARPEFRDLVEGVGVVPARRDPAQVRTDLATHGVVVVPSPSPRPDALVEVAAQVLGARLRQVFPLRPQRGVDGPHLALHADGAYVEGDVHGRRVSLRDPDEDFLLQRIDEPAVEGGASFLVDAYLLLDRVRDARPDLHAFLTGTDVDFFGGWAVPARGVPTTPLLRRMAEHTRAGRRVVRASDFAVPAPRTPDAEHDDVMLDTWADLLATADAAAPRFAPDPADVVVVDNYRFLHGRDAFRGPRLMHVLTVLSADSWACW